MTCGYPHARDAERRGHDAYARAQAFRAEGRAAFAQHEFGDAARAYREASALYRQDGTTPALRKATTYATMARATERFAKELHKVSERDTRKGSPSTLQDERRGAFQSTYTEVDVIRFAKANTVRLERSEMPDRPFRSQRDRHHPRPAVAARRAHADPRAFAGDALMAHRSHRSRSHSRRARGRDADMSYAHAAAHDVAPAVGHDRSRRRRRRHSGRDETLGRDVASFDVGHDRSRVRKRRTSSSSGRSSGRTSSGRFSSRSSSAGRSHGRDADMGRDRSRSSGSRGFASRQRRRTGRDYASDYMRDRRVTDSRSASSRGRASAGRDRAHRGYNAVRFDEYGDTGPRVVHGPMSKSGAKRHSREANRRARASGFEGISHRARPARDSGYVDERDRGWWKQPRRHAKAAEQGWEHRRRPKRRGARGRDATLGMSPGRDRDLRSASYVDERDRGWWKQPRRHAKAAEQGWEHRRRPKRRGRGRDADMRDMSVGRDGERGWLGDRRRHAQAASRGWHKVARPGWRATNPHWPNEDVYHGPLYSTSGAASQEGYVRGTRRRRARSTKARSMAKMRSSSRGSTRSKAPAKARSSKSSKKRSRDYDDYDRDATRSRTRHHRTYRHSRFGYQ